MKREAPAWLAPGQRGAIHSSITNITKDSPRVHAKTASEILREKASRPRRLGALDLVCPELMGRAE
jgi:hypothetical protein